MMIQTQQSLPQPVLYDDGDPHFIHDLASHLGLNSPEVQAAYERQFMAIIGDAK